MKRNHALSECVSLKHITINDVLLPNRQHVSFSIYGNSSMNSRRLLHDYVSSERDIVHTFNSLEHSGQWLLGSFRASTIKGAFSLSNVFISEGVGGYFVGHDFRRSVPRVAGRVLMNSSMDDLCELYTPSPMHIFSLAQREDRLLKSLRRSL